MLVLKLFQVRQCWKMHFHNMRHIKMDLNIKKTTKPEKENTNRKRNKKPLGTLKWWQNATPKKNVGNGLWEAMSMNRSIAKRSWKRGRASDAIEMGKVYGGGGTRQQTPSHWHFWVPYNSNNNKEAAVDLLWLTVMRRTSWHFCFCFIFCFLFWQDNEINTQPDTNSSSRNVLQSLQTHTHTFIYINCKASVGADREHTTKKRRRGKNLTR